MKAETISSSSKNLTSLLLGALAVGLVLAVLTGRKIPLIGSERAALAVLVVLGMAMCSNATNRVAAARAWGHPLAILGYVIGAVILLVALAGFFGWQLPVVDGARQAIIAVSVLGVLKVGLSTLHRTVWLRSKKV